jgi:two-component system, chemotaxis family, protein-glutamate methylesterase/glutaminase
VAVVEKPSGEADREHSRGVFDHLVEVVQTAARSKPRPRKEEFRHSPAKKSQAHPPSGRLAVLGASLGGTEALQEVLSQLPMDHPGLVVVQHMPMEFTGAFARRLDQNSNFSVKEAQDGDWVLDGQALLAPGGVHLCVEPQGNHFRVRTLEGPTVHHVKPSVDILFHSAARAAGSRALGALLTGMGRDGAEGLLAMRRAGAMTLAQDQASCVVYGMPKEAVERGAVERIVPLCEMAKVISREMKKTGGGVQ